MYRESPTKQRRSVLGRLTVPVLAGFVLAKGPSRGMKQTREKRRAKEEEEEEAFVSVRVSALVHYAIMCV